VFRRADAGIASAVVKAVEQKLHEGTTFGMPHEQEWELAEEICKRYPVDMVRFGSSGTGSHHACLPHRARRHGRDKILKFEGAYHGLHEHRARQRLSPRRKTRDPTHPIPFPGAVRAKGRARECCRRQLQQSEERRKIGLSSILRRSPRLFSSPS